MSSSWCHTIDTDHNQVARADVALPCSAATIVGSAVRAVASVGSAVRTIASRATRGAHRLQTGATGLEMNLEISICPAVVHDMRTP